MSTLPQPPLDDREASVPKEPAPDKPTAVPAAQSVAVLPRRGFVKRLARLMAGVKLARELGAGLTGAAAAGAAGYVYVNRELKQIRDEFKTDLENSDFTINTDTTGIKLNTAGFYANVEVSRDFVQVSKKDGRYLYECICLGKWVKDKCSLQFQDSAGVRTESIEIETQEDHQQKGARGAKDVNVVGRLTAKKSLDIHEGDKLKIKLLSVESVKLARFFYLLSLSSDIDESRISWAWDNPPAGMQPQCWVYNEKEALRGINHAIVTELHDYHEGVDILLKWGEEKV
jgi:hypothetical protein